jgi:predicted lipoprotein with Yx(FWY)xxD motif
LDLFLKSKLTILALVLAFLTTNCIAIDDMGEYSINLATNDTMGTYLVNQTGFALYYFMNDAPGDGISNCSKKCAEIWPPFYAEKISVAKGLNTTDFTSQIREDGKWQTAYKGWPLYLYSKDTKPKDVYGQGFNKVWYIVNPESSQFMQSTYPLFVNSSSEISS